MATISANGSTDITLFSGRIYTIAAGGSFGGGSLAASLLLDDDTPVPITGFPITAAANIAFPAGATRLRLTLTGATSPDISYAVNLSTGNTPASIGAETPAGAQAKADAAQSAAQAASARAIEIRTGNFTAVVGGRYITESGGTISITDPTGTTAGQSYEVWIGSGSIQFNGTGTVYSASRFSIRRRFNGSAWVTPAPMLTDQLSVPSIAMGNNIINEATTARTLALTDSGMYLRCSHASGCTVTVPLNASVPFPIGTEIYFRRAVGAGAITLAGSATINNNQAAIVQAGANFALKKLDTNTWDFI